MGLERQTESNIIYLAVKHFSIWREVKKPCEGSEAIEVVNPKTKATTTKHGFRYRTLSGQVTKIVKYDTADKYPTRYFGFKMTIQEGQQLYVLDMPYHSQVLRRFLRVARNIDWTRPLAISVFKAKSDRDPKGETGLWFHQNGETIKSYYSREQPHGMPAASQDPDTLEWDFRAQHRWLIQRLIEDTIPEVERAATRVAPPQEPDHGEEPEQSGPPMDEPEWSPSDDDVPF